MTRTDLPEDVAEEIRNRVFSESGFMKLTQVVRRRGGHSASACVRWSSKVKTSIREK